MDLQVELRGETSLGVAGVDPIARLVALWLKIQHQKQRRVNYLENHWYYWFMTFKHC